MTARTIQELQMQLEIDSLKAELFAVQQLAFTLDAELAALINQEPVGTVVDPTYVATTKTLPYGTFLYLAAGAKEALKPPTQEQIKEWRKAHPIEDLCIWSYNMGVSDTEKHYTKDNP